MLQKIQNDIKTAMRAKESEKRDLLRLIMAKANTTSKSDGDRETTDADVMSAIQKQIKQNNDAITIIKDNGRDASKEEKEVAILMDYLPQQKTEDEIKRIVESIISEIPEEKRNNKSRGLVMGKLRVYKDVMDMGIASSIAGELLNS